MKKTYKKPTANEIADLAESGKDISKYFTNKGKMKYPTQMYTGLRQHTNGQAEENRDLQGTN